MNWEMIVVVAVVALLGLRIAHFVLFKEYEEVFLVTDEAQVDGAKLTPAQAVELAAPHLEEHGTYHWNKERPLKTHVVYLRSWFGDRYYVKRTDYPFKTFRYIMHGAVIVDPENGQIDYAPPTGQRAQEAAAER